MASSPEEVKKSLKLYLLIGITLFIFTVVTVAVATVPALDFGRHGFDSADMKIGLAIASFKAFLVASVFMHLYEKNKLLYGMIVLTGFMAVALLILTDQSFNDPIEYGNAKRVDGFYNLEKAPTKAFE